MTDRATEAANALETFNPWKIPMVAQEPLPVMPSNEDEPAPEPESTRDEMPVWML